MNRKYRTYTKEFRLEALELLRTSDDGAVDYYRGSWGTEGSFETSTDFSAALRIAFFGDEADLTLKVGPDCSICDVYVDSSLWESFDNYAASAGEDEITIPLLGDGPHVLDLRNRREKNGASTGYRLGFKQLVIEQPYNLHTIQYGYDALARLTDADYYPGINTAATAFRGYDYSYDLAGNRTQRIVTVGGTPTETNYTYNAANQISSGGVTYDDAGRMTSDGTYAFTWDRADRLLTHQGVTSTYNGLGQRVSQTVSSITTDYLLDVQPGLWKVLAETTQGNTTHFVHGPRGLQATEDPVGSWSWAVQDGLGSVRLQADADLAVDGAQHFAPYGVPFGELGSFDAPFGFTGEQTDGNRQVYLRARYYNPDMGVFGTLDAVEGVLQEALSLNRYAFVSGNVINTIDPSGQIPSRADIEEGRTRYSCNCGWIDMSHVTGGGIQDASVIQTALTIPLNYAALNAIPNVRVIRMPEHFRLTTPFFTNFKAYVHDNAIQELGPMQVGVGIFMEYERTFETFQAVANPLVSLFLHTPSGFAEEDLPSTLMGYWLRLYYGEEIANTSNQAIFDALDILCGVMSLEASLFMYIQYTQFGLSRAFSTDWKHFHRRPRPDWVRFPDGTDSMCGSERWPAYFENLESIALQKAGDIDLTSTITFNRGFPTDGWYELKDGGLNQFFKRVDGVEGLYVVDSSSTSC